MVESRRRSGARILQVSLAVALVAGGALPLACKDDNAGSPGGTSPTATTTTTTPTPDSGPPLPALTGVGGPSDQATNQFAHPAGDVALGREVFRFETFGNEGFWTRVLQLPQGMKKAGVTPLQAIALGIMDPARTAAVPHPFFVADAAKRADVVKFLKSLDDDPLK